MQAVLLGLLCWLAIGSLITWFICRRTMGLLWREPILKHPVLIIESDDWGAGPSSQADQLQRILSMLASHSNRLGQKPVMSLGIVLSAPDGARMRSGEFRRHYRKLLDIPEFAPILSVIKRGVESGIFALQLHGAEHYWPPALLAASRTIPAVTGLLSEPEAPATELLPAALQSRWIDASVLPSRPLSGHEIKVAALAEVESFRSIFGTAPKVAIPPTFIWNDEVEAAWAEGGVKFIVTPGYRFEARDSDGNPVCSGSAINNGGSGAAGVMYLVRDDYFEPARGHKAELGVAALDAKTRLARPTLFETHRWNFICDSQTAEAALHELDRLLSLALRKYPGLLFLSTEQLALRMRQREPQLVEGRLTIRFHIWLRRLWTISRLRKLAFLTGIIGPAWVTYALTSHHKHILRQPAR